ncbi:hypothetical protein CDAR_601961 [Caerostris darwini]|uniref:Uncharacterized protein n=1 Tax=Caerostris darwini TaxID=1538125 RepID=A0AAV4S4L1_9ARAC|nr:hypothetical protein CDAR_601961 [Caerostris darwini]
MCHFSGMKEITTLLDFVRCSGDVPFLWYERNYDFCWILLDVLRCAISLRVYSPPEQEGGDEDGDEHDGGADGDDGQGGEGGPVVVGPHRAPFQAAVEVAVAAHGSQRGGRRGRGHPEVFPVVERREVLIAGHHLRQHEGALSGRLQKETIEMLKNT